MESPFASPFDDGSFNEPAAATTSATKSQESGQSEVPSLTVRRENVCECVESTNNLLLSLIHCRLPQRKVIPQANQLPPRILLAKEPPVTQETDLEVDAQDSFPLPNWTDKSTEVSLSMRISPLTFQEERCTWAHCIRAQGIA